ncbi:MAG: 50S ribosomal protein L29 [Elusimicrobia bacterium]|nr:50S ribosomal protein L29 [Elusimicrobiota bacterium]
MKSREKLAFHDQGVVELMAELRTAQERLFRERFRHAVTPLKNPLELRILRRRLAFFKTLLRQKGTRDF